MERGVASMTTIVTSSFTWPLTFPLALVKHVLPNEHSIDSAHVTWANASFTLFLVFCLHLSRPFQFMSIPIQYIQAELCPLRNPNLNGSLQCRQELYLVFPALTVSAIICTKMENIDYSAFCPPRYIVVMFFGRGGLMCSFYWQVHTFWLLPVSLMYRPCAY